jgi:hypothetical protein
MARTPDGITARSEHISARLRPSTKATLDKLRNGIPVSRYLERLIMEQEKREQER